MSGKWLQADRYGYVDDSREWVVGGPQRVRWILVAYTRGVQESYHWIESSLIMAGQDGVLRMLTFWGSS